MVDVDVRDVQRLAFHQQNVPEPELAVQQFAAQRLGLGRLLFRRNPHLGQLLGGHRRAVDGDLRRAGVGRIGMRREELDADLGDLLLGEVDHLRPATMFQRARDHRLVRVVQIDSRSP